MEKDKGNILIKTIIVFIILLIILSLGFLAHLYLQEIELSEEEPKNIIATFEELEKNVNTKKDNNQTVEVVMPIINKQQKEEKTNIASNYYYSQLDEYGKIIYAGLYSNKENLKSGNYKIDFGTKFNDLLNEANGENKLSIAFQSAWDAFSYDNVDVFYIDVTKMYINIETIQKIFSTKYNVYINSAKDPTYLLDGFTSKEQIDQCESQVIAVKNQILNQIAGKNDIEKMRYIHDYLVDTIEYDQTFGEKNIYNIYGALVSKTCVCEGYAKASQYLLNEAGLENIIITGTATNSDGKTENHAWNYVNIDEKWYAIDTTWDDPIIVGGGKLTNTIRYRYFLKGSSTMNKNHFISTKFTSGGQDFEFPKLSITDYNI